MNKLATTKNDCKHFFRECGGISARVIAQIVTNEARLRAIEQELARPNASNADQAAILLFLAAMTDRGAVGVQNFIAGETSPDDYDVRSHSELAAIVSSQANFAAQGARILTNGIRALCSRMLGISEDELVTLCNRPLRPASFATA